MNFNDMPKEELIKIEARIKLEIFSRRIIEVRRAMAAQHLPFSQLLRDKVSMLEHIVSYELTSFKRIHLIEDKLEELEIILNID